MCWNKVNNYFLLAVHRVHTEYYYCLPALPRTFNKLLKNISAVFCTRTGRYRYLWSTGRLPVHTTAYVLLLEQSNRLFLGEGRKGRERKGAFLLYFELVLTVLVTLSLARYMVHALALYPAALLLPPVRLLLLRSAGSALARYVRRVIE